MNFYPLVKKLIEIERAIDVLDSNAIRNMVIEAQDYALQIEQEAITVLGAEHGPYFRPPAAPGF